MGEKLVNMISELEEYITSGKKRLKTILDTLDWTEEGCLKKSTNPKSKNTKQNYDKNDSLLPKSFGCKNSIVIDDDKLKYVLVDENASIPKKISDIQLNFTREQKVKLYEYTINHTTKLSEPELKVSFSNDDYSMTFAEIVAKAKKKDKKIQRKYRTSKPTHIEEVRNLVHLQMQALDKYFNPDSEKTPYKDKSIKNEESFHDSGRSLRVSPAKRKSRSRSRDRSRRSNSRDISDRSRNDKKIRVKRSRSKDRSNRSLDRKSSSEERKRKHRSESIKNEESFHYSGRSLRVSPAKRKSRSRSRDRSRRSNSRDISDRSRNDKKIRVKRSRSKDRSNRSLDRKSSSEERKRKHRSEKRKKHKDDSSVDRIKKHRSKSRSPMSSSSKKISHDPKRKKTKKKKHKHHRK